MASNPETSLYLPSPLENEETNAGFDVEKRRESRYPCDDPAEVRGFAGDVRWLSAQVLDVSGSGMRLETGSPLKRGLEVEILLPKQAIVLGDVQSCRRVGESFRSGVRIHSVFYIYRPGSSNHIPDSQIWLYRTGRGLAAWEVLSLRDHLLECGKCSARYYFAVKLQQRLGMAGAEGPKG